MSSSGERLVAAKAGVSMIASNKYCDSNDAAPVWVLQVVENSAGG